MIGTLWRRIPVLVRAPIAGAAVLAAGTLPWLALSKANGRLLPEVPWAVVPMAAYLWLYWRWLRGDGWPRATAEGRRRSLRANPLSGELWGAALLTGLLGLTALVPLLSLMSRVVSMPAESQPIRVPPGMSAATVAVLLVMASLVAGVTEEAAFRGYIQRPIEKRHGVAAAILTNGVFFGLAHVSHHPAAILTMLPYYLAVAGVYGGLAWATDSILPGVALHAGGDVFSLTREWLTGRPEWELSAGTPGNAVAGGGLAIAGSAAALVALGGASVWAYRALARAARADARQDNPPA